MVRESNGLGEKAKLTAGTKKKEGVTLVGGVKIV